MVLAACPVPLTLMHLSVSSAVTATLQVVAPAFSATTVGVLAAIIETTPAPVLFSAASKTQAFESPVSLSYATTFPFTMKTAWVDMVSWLVVAAAPPVELRRAGVAFVVLFHIVSAPICVSPLDDSLPDEKALRPVTANVDDWFPSAKELMPLAVQLAPIAVASWPLAVHPRPKVCPNKAETMLPSPIAVPLPPPESVLLDPIATSLAPCASLNAPMATDWLLCAEFELPIATELAPDARLFMPETSEDVPEATWFALFLTV